MSTLFTGGKISGIFTLAFQGITKAVGLLTKAVITVIDQVVDIVTDITAPLTDALMQLPIVGETIGTVLNIGTGLVAELSNGVHAISDEFIAGDLLGGVSTALNGTTSLLGQSLNGVSDILDNVLATTAPITSPLTNLPILGDVVSAVGQTSSNLNGLIAETGDYISSIQPIDLVTSVLNNPVASVGGVIQDVSGTLDSLLDDLAPVTTTVSTLPVIGDIITTVGTVVGSANHGLYDLGTQLNQSNAFELELNLPLQFG